MATSNETLHVQISVTLNDSNYGWSDPQSFRRINFEMPVQMFHSPTFTKMLDSAIAEIMEEFPVKVAEFEKAQAEKQLAEANA